MIKLLDSSTHQTTLSIVTAGEKTLQDHILVAQSFTSYWPTNCILQEAMNLHDARLHKARSFSNECVAVVYITFTRNHYDHSLR